MTLERLDVGGDDDVLEVGFGGGGLLAMLLRATSGTVAGVDPAGAMVKRAQRRFRREPRLRLHRGSVEALPFEDKRFDRACSVNNIYFWPDPPAALRELARVLREGGRLAVCFEPPEELRKWPGHRFGFRLVDEAEVRQLMEEAGFARISHAEGRGRMPDRFLCLTGERARAEARP
ncbi:class I SAM-dependent methyltransferase [Sphingosinicella sp. CPCC 101087]|uniref:class I SAM-dependent methyltransferase n=1 Tax=Sphingosinicella sp. CPCC 101087 TaxID=2497754 RepID=UPI0013EB170C|nr:class I SAM-dependent methyltransferase [Sphingosinicella sp. CPCC 101087]